jgi:neutral ceramidase
MKIRVLISFLAILTIFLPECIFAQRRTKQVNLNQSNYLVMGVSRVNITPEKPAMMSGYGNRITPSTAVNDSIYASAFFFSGNNVKMLLITADLLGFSFEFVDEMKSLISSKTGVNPGNIMLVAAHNHGGPSIRDQSEYGKKYTNDFINNLVKISVEASRTAVPFRMGVGKGTCKMNVNRRAEFSVGEVWLGKDPDGPCDHDLSVIKFETLDSRPIAVLINWPCHGTSTGYANYEISGDWPGSAARYIRKNMKDEVVVGVTAGASGDINPIYGPGTDFREVEAMGYQVGNETMKVLEHLTTYPVKTLQLKDTILVFPGKSRTENHFPKQSFEPGPPVTLRLSALKIGNLILAGISGEVFTEIGMEIKNQSPYSETVVMTHCNGSSGYIITDSSYPKGGYEVQVTRLMPGAEKPIIRTMIDLINTF